MNAKQLHMSLDVFVMYTKQNAKQLHMSLDLFVMYTKQNNC